jgi:maltodextrin utilization protein YvdJ
MGAFIIHLFAVIFDQLTKISDMRERWGRFKEVESFALEGEPDPSSNCDDGEAEA